MGVEALNTAICLRQSARERDVDNSDVDNAKAVGALCIINAINTTTDNPVGTAESFASAEDPNASPSAKACTTNPKVRGYAFFFMSRSTS